MTDKREYTHRRTSDGKPTERGYWRWGVDGNGYGRWTWVRLERLEDN